METTISFIPKPPICIASVSMKQAIENADKKVNYYEAEIEDDENKFKSHAAEPITSKDNINRMIAAAYENGDFCKITRFILGINTGFRDSDLRNIKVKDIFRPDGTVKDFYAPYEKKTLNTRKKPRARLVYLNDTVKKSLTFLVKVTGKNPQDYMFTADKKKYLRKYLDYSKYEETREPDDIAKTDKQFAEDGTKRDIAFMETSDYCKFLKKLAKSLGMEEHCSTHCQRKTYVYWMALTRSKWEQENGSYIFSAYDIRLISHDLGHADLRTTAKYYCRGFSH